MGGFLNEDAILEPFRTYSRALFTAYGSKVSLHNILIESAQKSDPFFGTELSST